MRAALLLLLLLAPSAVVGYVKSAAKLNIQKKSSRQFMIPLLSKLATSVPVAQSIVAVASVIAFHEAGHFLAAKSQNIKISSYNVGYGPKLFSVNDSSNIEYALRAIPFGGYVSFPTNVEFDEVGEVIRELDDPDLLQNRPPAQRALVISGGVIANLLLSFLLSSGLAITTGIGPPLIENGVVVNKIIQSDDANTPAVKAGLRKLDVILEINNEKILANEKQVDLFVQKIRARPEETIQLKIKRGNEVFDTSITPVRDRSSGRGTIGVGIGRNLKNTPNLVSKDIFTASKIGFDTTVGLLKLTWIALVNAISTGFSGNEIGGPIAIVKAGAELAHTSSVALIQFMISLSVNLAVLNALPVPALDGGQLALVAVEKIRNKKLPRRADEIITITGFFLFLTIGITTVLRDISIDVPAQLLQSKPFN